MTSLNPVRPRSTRDLSPFERRFAVVLQQLCFGRIESLRIRAGAPVLDPWPTTVRFIKFGAGDEVLCRPSSEFELKRPLAELFEYMRGVEEGEIRHLVIRHGLPISMEVEHRISRGMPDVKGEHVEAV